MKCQEESTQVVVTLETARTVFIAATSHPTMAAEVRRGQQRAMGLDGKKSRHLLIVHSETTAGVRNLTLAS